MLVVEGYDTFFDLIQVSLAFSEEQRSLGKMGLCMCRVFDDSCFCFLFGLVCFGFIPPLPDSVVLSCLDRHDIERILEF